MIDNRRKINRTRRKEARSCRKSDGGGSGFRRTKSGSSKDFEKVPTEVTGEARVVRQLEATVEATSEGQESTRV